MTTYELPGKRLEAAIRTVTDKCTEVPYECSDETFVVWQATGEDIVLTGSDSALRMCMRYRVIIFARGAYETMKVRLYAALLMAGFELAAMGGEIFNDVTQRREWPIDVMITYDLAAALDAANKEEEE